MGAVSRENGGTSPAEERVGSYVRGAWHLDAVIGVGGMSNVYSATRPNGKRAAIKIQNLDVASDPVLREQFLREAVIARAINHPARVAGYAHEETDRGELMLVMELVEGDSLDKVWRRLGRKLPLVSALLIADQVLDFLATSHDLGIVHRDIKPTNLILTRERKIKVVDFGIAHAPTLVGPAASENVTLGTPSFMAPEQAIGNQQDIDGRADLFSVGALLYTLLGGQLLNRGRDHDESLLMAATKRAPSLADITEGLPKDVIALVDLALSPRRDDRFPDARAMRGVLSAILRREEARLTAEPRAGDFRDDDESGERTRATTPGRKPDAKGLLGDMPLPTLIVHAHSRKITGTLSLYGPRGRRDVQFVEGAPSCVLGEGAATLAALHRLGALPPTTDFEFYIAQSGDDLPDPALLEPCDPLAAVMAVTRRWTGGPLLRKTLSQLGERPLVLHPAAQLDRFQLTPLENEVVAAANGLELSYEQLLDAEVAPALVVDAVVYALGVTRHLDLKVAGAWPLAVPTQAR
jgi:serine/threonine protein kinase